MPHRPTARRRGGRAWVALAAALVGSALLASACQSPGPGAPSETAASLTAASSVPVGLQAALTSVVDRTTVPSAVVLVRSSRYGDATYAFGTTQLGGTQPVGPKDHVRAGSVTKTMTATVILQLAQEGRLSLDAPVSTYVTNVPGGEGMTVAQLLDMRSGLDNYAEDPGWSAAVDAEPQRVWTPRETLGFAFAHPPYFPPGSGFHYSNTSYILLGMIMEQITGQTASELFTQRLFAPSGMKDTTLPTLSDASIPQPFAHGYHYGSFDSALPADQQAQARAGTLRPQDVSDINPSWAWTAGSVISTAEDLAVWSRALVSGSLLTPATQQRRLDSVRGLGPAYPQAEGVYAYGYGLDRRGSYYGHEGVINGYNTAMSTDPQTGTTVIAVATLTLSPDGAPVARLLADTVKSALAGLPGSAPTSSNEAGALSPEETARP